MNDEKNKIFYWVNVTDMKPTNNLVNSLLTDHYQLTMAYAYWKNARDNDKAVFDLFFRKNPFGGEFTIFAGLEEVLKFVSNFKFTDEQVDYIKEIMPSCDEKFFNWLKTVDCSKIKIYAIKEGTVIFPLIPLIRIQGPLAIAQLLETTLLTLVNYSSLITTNAARHRIAAGKDKMLLEFGLRRAQGPDGGISASRYSYIGGFDGTSNVLAGKLFGIPVKGTHAHAFVQSYLGIKDLKDHTITGTNGKQYDFVQMVFNMRKELDFNNTNEGELCAFIAYAQSFPKNFLALVDSYDTLKSGVPNFICVALALAKIGYKPVGVRLDSGDLAYLSKETRKMFRKVSEQQPINITDSTIIASNDINEQTLLSLNQQGHEINSFGIGTNLVTCQTQPALGCVYKLVEINKKPRIKLSQDVGKITIPGKKEAYRLIGEDSRPVLDIMIQVGEKPPQAGEKILCRHPFNETKRVYVTPSGIIPLHECVWEGKLNASFRPLSEIKQYVLEQLNMLRIDHVRALNPTPYKVSVSSELYAFIHKLWLEEAPITEIK